MQTIKNFYRYYCDETLTKKIYGNDEDIDICIEKAKKEIIEFQRRSFVQYSQTRINMDHQSV